MAQHDPDKLEIDHGPSKLELMLSLFDTSRGPLVVTFHTTDGGSHKMWITSAKQTSYDAKQWLLEGTMYDSGETVAICYSSDTCKGYLQFLPGKVSHLPDSQKATALMVIIHRMIAAYQNYHRGGHLDQSIFTLFEKAKRVESAKDRESFLEAIKDI